MRVIGSRKPDEIDTEIRRVLAGDRLAYRAIVSSFERPVRWLMASLLPAGISAEDLTQETFVVAFQRLREYALDGTFALWLRGVARNLAVRERRRHLRRRELDRLYEREIEEPVITWVDQRLDELAAFEAEVQLRECLSQLRETPRRVLERYYFDGTPADRIAADEKRPRSWVYLVMFRARHALTVCLESKVGVPGAV